jgi:hypothetical protein
MRTEKIIGKVEFQLRFNGALYTAFVRTYDSGERDVWIQSTEEVSEGLQNAAEARALTLGLLFDCIPGKRFA